MKKTSSLPLGNLQPVGGQGCGHMPSQSAVPKGCPVGVEAHTGSWCSQGGAEGFLEEEDPFAFEWAVQVSGRKVGKRYSGHLQG